MVVVSGNCGSQVRSAVTVDRLPTLASIPHRARGQATWDSLEERPQHCVRHSWVTNIVCTSTTGLTGLHDINVRRYKLEISGPCHRVNVSCRSISTRNRVISALITYTRHTQTIRKTRSEAQEHPYTGFVSRPRHTLTLHRAHFKQQIRMWRGRAGCREEYQPTPAPNLTLTLSIPTLTLHRTRP